MSALLDPSLVEAIRFLGAAVVVFAGAVIYYHRMNKKEGLKHRDK